MSLEPTGNSQQINGRAQELLNEYGLKPDDIDDRSQEDNVEDFEYYLDDARHESLINYGMPTDVDLCDPDNEKNLQDAADPVDMHSYKILKEGQEYYANYAFNSYLE